MATKQQIPVLVARLTEFQEEFSILPTESAQWVIMNGKEAAALCAQAIANRMNEITKKQTKAINPILGDIVVRVAIPATTSEPNFVVAHHFWQSTLTSRAKIVYRGKNFYDWFIKKIEEPFSGGVLYGRPLKSNSIYCHIISELGGEENAEITMTEIFAMMVRQANGEAGDLLVNGSVNAFFVRDGKGTLRLVFLHWNADGWCIEANLVDSHINELSTGCLVFSRAFNY